MFSPNEQKILDLLGNNKMTVTEITTKVYRVPKLNGSAIIANSINRIVRKCEFHKLTWTLKSEGGGRGGKLVWKAKR